MAQLCTGTFGTPLINQTFGQGNDNDSWYGPLSFYAPGASTYTAFQGPPGAIPLALSSNKSGLVKTPATLGNPYPIYWQNHPDHTGNRNGLMLLIDGVATPTVFFEQKMEDLCPNTTLRLSIWVLNTNASLANAGNPNMILRVIDLNDNILGRATTGDVRPDGNWHQFNLDFNKINSSTVTLQLINNTSTNNGNDFALDDITVQACGPTINTFLNTNNRALSMCEGQTQNFTLNANILPEYSDPVYQWQEYNGTAWVNLLGKTTNEVIIDFVNRTPGTYQYRLITAINGNIDKVNCRAISDPLIVTVNSLPAVIASNTGSYCIGSDIQLKATGGNTYLWSGPNSFSSTDQNPVISNATSAMAGDYIVTAFVNNCSNTTTTTVEILAPVIGSTNVTNVNICEITNTTLIASGGNNYTWFPSDGLSDPNSAQTVASPKKTTTYTVNISNGACYETKEIKVNVIKSATADAGIDQKMIIGNAITLKGLVSGDDVTYFWTPTDFLDDPNKLNPIANPQYDITYTLNVISADCISASDHVFVKVYPKIEISNSLSPNGDGINDTWNIPVALAFANPRLKIMNRYGELIYESTGNFKPWNGKFNGKDLPVGTYYYNIYFNDDFKTYSGWVFLTR